jgi:heat shock protein HtpX
MYEQISGNKWKSAALVVFFMGFIFLLTWFFEYVTGWGKGGLVLALLVAMGMAAVGYFQSDRIVLGISRAKPVTKEEYPYLYNVVEGLAIAAGIPAPKCYVIDDTAPNAFATGRKPETAVICVTTGLLQKLNRVELEGVVAHEMSHIKNYDIRGPAGGGAAAAAAAAGRAEGARPGASSFSSAWLWPSFRRSSPLSSSSPSPASASSWPTPPGPC